MKVLIVGGGGREHALAWKLAQSNRITRMWCVPGNPGIAQERLTSNGEAIICHPLAADNISAILDFAKAQKPELTIVGPDNPLALGIVDLFQRHGLRIWGPTQRAALFESSKAFSQEFMARHDIPTARSEVFSQQEPAFAFVRQLEGRCAVKADGLALGKGVVICRTPGEAEAAVREMLEGKKFGAASARIVIQELLEGMEVSLHLLCDGTRGQLFPVAQDHKRAFENDEGPNTGGMGAYCPAPFLSGKALEVVRETIVNRWLEGCRKDGIVFRGMLYPGIMLTREGARVLEFNARFGDPEAQVYLAGLKTDLLESLEASESGNLSLDLEWKPQSTVCVVMASAGYPGPIRKEQKIHGLEEAARLPNVKVFHAGTAGEPGNIVNNGGRVLGVTGWGKDLATAQTAAYEAVGMISFHGAHYRRDIGAKAIQFRAIEPALSATPEG